MTDKFGRPINRDTKIVVILKLQMLQKVISEITTLNLKWKRTCQHEKSVLH